MRNSPHSPPVATSFCQVPDDRTVAVPIRQTVPHDLFAPCSVLKNRSHTPKVRQLSSFHMQDPDIGC